MKPCAVEGCEVKLFPYNVLCPKHWWMASPSARRALANHFDRTKGIAEQSPEYNKQLEIVIKEARNKAAWDNWARSSKTKKKERRP